jgi:prevent-host-death family protein
MPARRMSSRQFNQDTSGAKRAARSGPVVITERGRPAHVLLTFDAYRRLAETRGSIVDWLALPAAAADIDLEVPPLRDPARPAELD